jgi:hypothetical protein
MARHLKSANVGSPASFVSARHASATAGQKRLIRLGRAANDNQAPHSHWLAWVALGAAAVATAVILVPLI